MSLILLDSHGNQIEVETRFNSQGIEVIMSSLLGTNT